MTNQHARSRFYNAPEHVGSAGLPEERVAGTHPDTVEAIVFLLLLGTGWGWDIVHTTNPL